jgi:class 3 adenylate cyclase
VRLGDRYPEVLAAHCALLRAAFVAHEGREVDTQGDSFFVVFRRATQAVAASPPAHCSAGPLTELPKGHAGAFEAIVREVRTREDGRSA